MKNGKAKFATVCVCAVLTALTLAGCKKGDKGLDGTYKFNAPQEESNYSVLFKLNNPQKPLGDGYFETTAYVSLKGVYIRFRKIEGNSVALRLEQCRKVEDKFQKEISFEAGVQAKGSNYGVWYEPFDFSGETLGNRAVESYSYYRLSSTESACYVEEIAFIGEILEGQGSNKGTGEYCIIPVTIEAATPQGSESQKTAIRNAGILIDEQPSSVTDVLK